VRSPKFPHSYTRCWLTRKMWFCWDVRTDRAFLAIKNITWARLVVRSS
jgi:hypothetical protein